MPVTGYTVDGLGGRTVHCCPDCADALGLEADGRRVTEITTSQYRHGNGGGECVLCGFDTLDALSGKVVRGERDDLGTRTGGPESDDLAPYADVIDVATDAFVTIQPAPGEDPVEEELAPGIKHVHHGDIAETLVAELPADADVTASDVADALADAPVTTRVEPDYRGNGEDAVLVAFE